MSVLLCTPECLVLLDSTGIGKHLVFYGVGSQLQCEGMMTGVLRLAGDEENRFCGSLVQKESC